MSAEQNVILELPIRRQKQKFDVEVLVTRRIRRLNKRRLKKFERQYHPRPVIIFGIDPGVERDQLSTFLVKRG